MSVLFLDRGPMSFLEDLIQSMTPTGTDFSFVAIVRQLQAPV